MSSLPTVVPVAQIPVAMVPDESDKAKYQTSSTSQPLAVEPALTMDPYQKPPQANPLANHPALDLNALQQPSLHPATQPPQLRTPLASEPAEQWASSTIQAVADDNLANVSAVSTPGPQVPGAYPSLLPSAETVQKDLEYAKEVAASALSTAGVYAAQAGQTVAAALSSAKQPAAEAAQNVGSTVAQGATVAGQAAVNTAANAANAAAPVVANGANAAGRTAADAGNTLASTAVSAGQTAAETARNAGQATAETASSTGQTVTSGVVSAGQTTAETTKSAGNTVASGVAAAPYVAADTVRSAGNTVVSGVTAAPQVAADTAKAAGSTVTSTVVAAENTVMGTVKAAGATAAQYLPSAIASYLPGTATEAPKPHVAHSTAVTDPTGNMKNGLEALDGTSFAKLPEEARVDHTSHSTAVTDPTGNEKNGLEGLRGQSLAKLPEERKVNALPSHDDEHSKFSAAGVGALPGHAGESGVARLPDERNHVGPTAPVSQVGAVPYDPSTQNKNFGASYLNPNLVLAPEPSNNLEPAVKSTALPPRNVPEDPVNAPSTHHPAKRYEQHNIGGTHGADTDASIRSLAGSSITGEHAKDPSNGVVNRDLGKEREHHDPHRGTFENKPLNESQRGGVDPHVETLRAHDAATKKPSPTETVVESVKPRGHEGPFDRHAGTAENKPVHESTRSSGAPAVPAKDTSSSPSTANRTASEDSAGKKTGFMSKVKGEMKVLSGKLTHKEEKIEEGKKLMGKN